MLGYFWVEAIRSQRLKARCDFALLCCVYRLQALDEEMVAVQRKLSGVMIDQAGLMSPNKRLTLATVSSDLEQNRRANEFTEFGTSSTDTLLAPFAPAFGGEGLGMRGDGKFEAGSGKFESLALDQALMDYEADAIEDFLFNSQASSLQPLAYRSRSTWLSQRDEESA